MPLVTEQDPSRTAQTAPSIEQRLERIETALLRLVDALEIVHDAVKSIPASPAAKSKGDQFSGLRTESGMVRCPMCAGSDNLCTVCHGAGEVEL